MRGKLAGVVGVWFLAGVALAAADFWEEKDFTAWSDKEVEKMLTDSPWAKGAGSSSAALRKMGCPSRRSPRAPPTSRSMSAAASSSAPSSATR